MTDPEREKWFTLKELSVYLGGRVTVRKLAYWRKHHQGPPWVKLEGRVLYPVSRVETWMADRGAKWTSPR